MSDLISPCLANSLVADGAVVDDIRRRIINVERKIDILVRNEVCLSPTEAASVVSDSRDQKYGPRTYAQHGDDLVILNIFDMLKIAKPSYLDIGAHDPFNISNTALLYQRGCRGINVEANPTLIKAFHTQRPEDVSLNVGVAATPGTMTFYMFDDRSGINTFSSQQVSLIERGTDFRVKKTIEVSVMTVSQILEKHWPNGFPDLLSLDVEGLDLEVLKSIEYDRSAPKLICVEANSAKIGAEITDFAETKGYSLFFRAAANLFLIKNEFISALRR
jgi:FkbM family methyltransferase